MLELFRDPAGEETSFLAFVSWDGGAVVGLAPGVVRGASCAHGGGCENADYGWDGVVSLLACFVVRLPVETRLFYTHPPFA